MWHSRTRAALLTLLLTAPLVLAAGRDTEVKGVKARAAVKKYDRAVEQADAAHRKAVSDAGKVLLAELAVAKREAMKAENLPEATAVQELVDRTKRELDALGGGNETKLKQRVVGRWQGRWQSGQEHGCTFTADGRFTSSRGASLAFEVETDGAAVVYSERNPRHDVNRFTPVGGDRLLLESWVTWDEYQNGKPLSGFGIAHRVK